MRYKQFSVEERERIQVMLWQGASTRDIARALGRHHSSIAREIERNKPPLHNLYSPRKAHKIALESRKRRGRRKLDKDKILCAYVTRHLKLGWSPEQIAAKSEEIVGRDISHEAIYQFVYVRVSKASGLVYAKQEDLRPYLARRRKRRMKKGMRKPHRIVKGTLPSIDLRPKEVDERGTVGHWEDDSLVYTPTCPVRLRTTNERVSGIVFVNKVDDRTMIAANEITKKRFQSLPNKVRQTLTRDRGPENMGFEELEKKLGIKCFFAHAYSSWERGSNENVNGLVRRFFPKGTDFRKITDEEIRKVEYLLNSRPRKRLGWKTPYEVFYELTGVALQV